MATFILNNHIYEYFPLLNICCYTFFYIEFNKKYANPFLQTVGLSDFASSVTSRVQTRPLFVVRAV